MFEDLPELETKEFVRETCESIGWRFSNESHKEEIDDIIWFIEKLRPEFKMIEKRQFIKSIIYEFANVGHKETLSIIVYAQNHISMDIGDLFNNYCMAVVKHIPGIDKDSNFIWLYIEYLQLNKNLN